MTVTGGFGGTFGSIFGTTTVVSSGGGHAAIKAAIGQAQNDNTFWTVVQNRWNSNFTPGGTPMPFHWNNTFSYSSLASEFGSSGVHHLIRQRADAGLTAIANGSDDATWLDLGTWAQQLFDAQGPSFVPISRPFLEFDGDWFTAWSARTNGALLFNRAFRHACAKIRQNCPSMRFALCGDLGYTGVNVGDTADFTLWDQVMDGVSGELGIAEYISVTDTDTYSNGGPMGPSPYIENALVNWKAWAIDRGLQMGHGEWGIGQLPQSGGNHFYAPKIWADIYTNFWAGLPASGPGSLLYINLFDEGVIDGSVDWRGVSYVSGTFPGTSGVDGTNVANALKSAALTADSINVTGTGLLVGGGTLVASGHQNVILIADHPEVDHTGTTDCSDQLQAIITGAPNGTIIRGDPSHTYLMNQSGSNGGPINDSGATLVFDGTRNFIQFDGNGCTFKQTVDGPYTTTKTDPTSLAIVKRRNLHRAFFSFLGADHCKVFNATFIGSNPNNGTVYDPRYESQHILNLEGIDDFEAYGITAHHNWGDYCAMQPDVGSGVSCSNIHLHDYTYHDNGRQHLTLNGVTDLLVENANAFNIRHAQVDLEPNFTDKALKPQIKRCTFRNVTFGFMRLNLFSAGNTQAADVDTIVFDSCFFFQWKMPDVEGPWVGNRRKNLSIINCTTVLANAFGGPALTGTKLAPNGFGVTSQHGVSLGVQQWDGVTVTGNTIYLQNRSPTMVAVWCLDCTGINVHSNILNGTVFEIEIDVTPGAGTIGTGLLDGGGTLAGSGFPTQLATSAVLIGGGTLVGSGTVGVTGTGLLDGGGSLDGTGLAFDIVDVAGTAALDGGGALSAVGLVLELGDGFLDGAGVLVAAGDVGQVDAVGVLDGGGVLEGSADVGQIGIFGTGVLDGGGVLVASGRHRRRHGWHIGPIRLRPPGYGRGPYGKGPYGGLN